MKYKDGLSVAEHLKIFLNIINQLATMNMTIEDELQSLLLLGSLPNSWETFVVSVSNSAPNRVLTLDNVKKQGERLLAQIAAKYLSQRTTEEARVEAQGFER